MEWECNTKMQFNNPKNQTSGTEEHNIESLGKQTLALQTEARQPKIENKI